MTYRGHNIVTVGCMLVIIIILTKNNFSKGFELTVTTRWDLLFLSDPPCKDEMPNSRL